MQRQRRCRRNAVSNILPILQRLGLASENPGGDDAAVAEPRDDDDRLSSRLQPSAGPAVAPHGPGGGSASGMELDGPAVSGFVQMNECMARESSTRSTASDTSALSDRDAQWEESSFGLTRRRSSRHSQRRSASLPDEIGQAAAQIQARAAAGTLWTTDTHESS
eukprot:m.27483 g.27483  ORF g.27483 m.27483 type:complete len:164 (-) comp11927_c1_seq1:229-720(-)